MEYSIVHLEQFKTMLKKDIREGDVDAGVAEAYAGHFGLELSYTYRARITVTLDVTFEANPDCDPDQIDSTDFDIDLTTGYCSTIADVMDVSVNEFDIEEIEEA